MIAALRHRLNAALASAFGSWGRLVARNPLKVCAR
jgi:hypothetical protein